jgi:arylsulfatase A-like enzyme
MAEMFRDSGYQTAYIGKWHLDGHGRDSYIPPERRQGFDYWKVLECTHDYNESYYYTGDDPTKRRWEGYDAYAQTDDAIDYLRDHSDSESPFLLFLGFGGPHFPHDNAPDDLKALYPPDQLKLRENVPPESEERTRSELQGYYAHCTAIDTCVGRIVDAIGEAGLADDTILVFTSDHGDMHGSQGKRSWRKQVPWDESACVPFLLRYPPVTGSGRAEKTPINTPDILPTLLSLCDVPIPDTIEGDNLSPVVRGETSDLERAPLVMMVSPFGANDYRAYRGVRTVRYLYVRDTAGPWLLYDNENDPFQLTNLVDDPAFAEIRDDLDARLQTELDRIGDSFPDAETARKQWGYTVDESGAIPYTGTFLVQSPGPERGIPASFGGE